MPLQVPPLNSFPHLFILQIDLLLSLAKSNLSKTGLIFFLGAIFINKKFLYDNMKFNFVIGLIYNPYPYDYKDILHDILNLKHDVQMDPDYYYSLEYTSKNILLLLFRLCYYICDIINEYGYMYIIYCQSVVGVLWQCGIRYCGIWYMVLGIWVYVAYGQDVMVYGWGIMVPVMVYS